MLIEAQPEPNCSCDQRDRSSGSCIEIALIARAIEPLPARTALALAFIEHNRMKPLPLPVHFDAQEPSSSPACSSAWRRTLPSLLLTLLHGEFLFPALQSWLYHNLLFELFNILSHAFCAS